MSTNCEENSKTIWSPAPARSGLRRAAAAPAPGAAGGWARLLSPVSGRPGPFVPAFMVRAPNYRPIHPERGRFMSPGRNGPRARPARLPASFLGSLSLSLPLPVLVSPFPFPSAPHLSSQSPAWLRPALDASLFPFLPVSVALPFLSHSAWKWLARPVLCPFLSRTPFSRGHPRSLRAQALGPPRILETRCAFLTSILQRNGPAARRQDPPRVTAATRQARDNKSRERNQHSPGK